MLKVYRFGQSDDWDEIIHSFENYDVYWLSGYVKAFELHGDGEPILFYYEDDLVRGINVVMKRDVAQDARFKDRIDKNKYYDFASPYGYGGWIIDGENTGKLFESYENWLQGNDIICEFVRFHPMLQNQEKCTDFYQVVPLGEVVHMDLRSPESIWENITSKNRNVIRKAIKNDVKIYNGRFPEIYSCFREIYDATMVRDDAEEYYYFDNAFYESILYDLPYNSQVFYAVKGNEVIAASIMLMANGMMNYHLSGSRREYSSLAATNLLLYEAALWGCANGYRTFYLGGGVGSGEDSLFKFKRAFYRGNLNHFYIGKKIYDKEKYEELVAMRGNIESAFFPLYRA